MWRIAAHPRFDQGDFTYHSRRDPFSGIGQLALALALKQLGKEVRVWNEDGMLEKYSFLPQAELLSKPPGAAEDFDVAVALDTAIQNRLGSPFDAIRSTKTWINIDHHPSNPRYGELVYIDPTAPATGQILFELLKTEKLPIDREIAKYPADQKQSSRDPHAWPAPRAILPRCCLASPIRTPCRAPPRTNGRWTGATPQPARRCSPVTPIWRSVSPPSGISHGSKRPMACWPAPPRSPTAAPSRRTTRRPRPGASGMRS
jgi:hypothetical protein